MKGIEVSVLTEAELREDAHPYATECHYSLFWDEYVRGVGELESRIVQGYVKSRLDTMPTARECRKVLKVKAFRRF